MHAKLRRGQDQNPDGLGMGLRISESILQELGGDIMAHSDGRGRGSTFSFWIKLPRPGQAELAVEVP